MRKFANKKWTFLALALVLSLAVPARSYGFNWFSQWWLNSLSDPVPDLEFTDVTTARARLSQILITDFQFSSSERISFDPVDITATVASGELTFDDIILTNGATEVTVTIDPVPLRTDFFGSSFRTYATVTVDSADGTSEFEALVRGRIVLRNGVYYLSATLFGNSVTRISAGNYLIDTLSLSLQGSAEDPTN